MNRHPKRDPDILWQTDDGEGMLFELPADEDSGEQCFMLNDTGVTRKELTDLMCALSGLGLL